MNLEFLDIMYGSKWLLEMNIKEYLNGQVMIHSPDAIKKKQKYTYNSMVRVPHIRGILEDFSLNGDMLTLQLYPIARKGRTYRDYIYDGDVPSEWGFTLNKVHWNAEEKDEDLFICSEDGNWHVSFILSTSHIINNFKIKYE